MGVTLPNDIKSYGQSEQELFDLLFSFWSNINTVLHHLPHVILLLLFKPYSYNNNKTLLFIMIEIDHG